METNFLLETAVPQTSTLIFLWRFLRNPLNALSELALEQGDIARIKLPKRDIFLLSHPTFIEQVFIKQAGNFIKGPALQESQTILGEGLLASEGDEHLAQRRALQPAFHRQKMEDYLTLMNKSIQTQLTTWQNDTQVNISEEMMRLTLTIALETFFGNTPENAVKQVGESVDKLIRLFPLTRTPLAKPAQRWLPDFNTAKDDLIQITEMLMQRPTEKKQAHRLIDILKENHEGLFTDQQIHAHALTFLLAGHETTALLLAWSYDLLAHHPIEQAKLQAEVDAVLGDRLPTLDDIQNLQYTGAFVKEVLRIRPPAWAIGREAVNDCEIGGQHIPAGSTVLLSQWVTHYDSRFYSDAHRFHPQRWLDPKQNSMPRYRFFPFGGGRRVCIGENFAMTEAIAILAITARHWNIHAVTEKPAIPKASITLRPKNGIQVKIKNRQEI